MKFEDFTGLYPVSKTLRFEAKPVGATLENIIKSGILEEDTHRAQSYQKVKKLIDEYHKAFIDSVMSNFNFHTELLEEYSSLYTSKSKDEKSKENFIKLQGEMRKQIAKALTSDERFKNIGKQELVKEDLFGFISHASNNQLTGLTKEQAAELVLEFKNLTTYFSGFHQNRANMYVADEKSTSIAYRLVNENLPRFMDNVAVFKEVASLPEIRTSIDIIYNSLKEYLNTLTLADMFNPSFYNEVLDQKQIDLYIVSLAVKQTKNPQRKFKV